MHLPFARAGATRKIYDKFMDRAVARTSPREIIEGNPYDSKTMIGAQASNDQLGEDLELPRHRQEEGAKVLTGGERRVHAGELKDGYYIKPTILEGHNKMR